MPQLGGHHGVMIPSLVFIIEATKWQRKDGSILPSGVGMFGKTQHDCIQMWSSGKNGRGYRGFNEVGGLTDKEAPGENKYYDVIWGSK